jgi:hypothetical protein
MKETQWPSPIVFHNINLYTAPFITVKNYGVRERVDNSQACYYNLCDNRDAQTKTPDLTQR